MAVSRIASLPRRDWRKRAEPYVEPLSEVLRTKPGNRLRLVQTAALLEVSENHGVFVNGRVGVGKTLAVALASVVLAVTVPEVRALILCPGGMKVEMNAHLASLRENWRLPTNYLLMSYTQISNFPGQNRRLQDLFGEGKGPTVIICDEADALKYVSKSAVGRQMNDYMVAKPDTVFVAVTGTCDVHGLMDYAHLLDWCLRDKSPLPRTEQKLKDWSEVIDEGNMDKARWVCFDLGIPLDSKIATIRASYRSRLVETPGVIIEDKPFDDVELTVQEHVIDPGCEEDFRRLRELWIRPDGVELLPGGDEVDEKEDDRVEGSTIWPIARRMARGLCYIWDPKPPDEWMEARRRYFVWVRRALEGKMFYTELQARRYAESIKAPAWVDWEQIRETYTPQHKTVWLSNVALEFCIDWGERAPGVVWTEDTAFAVELSRRTGWVYYGSKGMSRTGLSILDASGDHVAIASRRANGTGRNLQYQWHRCLFVAPPNNSRDFEQATGRFHREGQVNPVHVDILLGCAEDFGSVDKMLTSAKRTAQSLYSQKAATVKWPRMPKPSAEHAAFRA